MDPNVGKSQLQQLVTESGLEQSKAQIVLSNFSDMFEIAATWERRAAEIQVTSGADVDAIKQAREGRLLLKQKRVEVEKTRKELKEDSLRQGRLIDGIAKVITGLIEPIEKDLEAKEKFVEIQEEKRQAEAKEKRIVALREFPGVDPSVYDLGRMTDEQFNVVVLGLRAQKVEAERVAREAEELKQKQEEERRRIVEENEKLRKDAEAERQRKVEETKKQVELEIARRKEQEEKERQIKAEADKRVAEEREAREKLEAEVREKKRIEEEEAKRKAAEERKAKRAPDKEKLLNFVKIMQDAWMMNYPKCKSEDAATILATARGAFEELMGELKKEAEEM